MRRWTRTLGTCRAATAWVGIQTVAKNLWLVKFPVRGHTMWKVAISLSTAHFSLENIKIFLWGLGLQLSEDRSRAEGKSLQHYPTLNSWNYVVSVLTSSSKNISMPPFPEALVIYLGIVETCPSVVRSGTAPQSLQQKPFLPCNLPCSRKQWIHPFVNAWETSKQPAPFYPCNQEHDLASSHTWSDAHTPLPTHSHTVTVVIIWMQVHGHHWWMWAKDFLQL